MTTIKLCLKVEFELDELRDAIADKFPLIELSDSDLEKLFIQNLQNRIYQRMPEDLGWQLSNNDYFRDLYVKLHDLQEDAEQELAKEDEKEWEHGYWKDTSRCSVLR